MKLPCTNQITTGKPEKHATSGDFCKVFTEEMSSLYLLSYLLTGDHQKAEQCFVAGLEDSVKGNPVFKEWASSWARRMIVENAIRTIAPRPSHFSGNAPAADLELNSELRSVRDKGPAFANVLELADFERFTFVMSVLERYSDQDCSVLLACAPQEIRDARTRALQRIAQSPGNADVFAPRRIEELSIDVMRHELKSMSI
jgi:hypothetical protein